MPELPTGTVTFLFTDVEGSTRLWDEHPEAMKAALARHDEILRDAIESHGGRVVKTTGDGVHAAFATANDAVDSAVAAQRALAAVQGPEGPLRVRMGVHTGAAEARDGDYYGTAVNRAARLMAAGHGGQVLVSHVTEELVRDTLPEDVNLRDLGEHLLRDLARSDRIFQLEVPDLDREFAPLRTLDSFPGNLPIQLTSFVGRDHELRAVAKALEAARLVTLTGVGGVGKTRLAIQLAADVLPDFPDGAWLCELAAADDPDAMIQLVAATLVVQPRAGTTLAGAVVDFLRSKHLLLVLDNCEHVLDAAGRLAESILAGCPHVRIVATSREGLAVGFEQVWPLRSMSLPGDAPVADDLGASDAVRLFEERARAVRPDFEVDVAGGSAIAEVCRRLDGIPLAIELAAARVVSMNPAEIARRLDERFRLLTGGRRTAVERHQTLRATVDWSYSLLDETDRTVFDRLGVFAGGFDAASAEAVVSGDGVEAWDVVDALSDLVSKSMVGTELGPDGATRYQMLETMRHYARERLDAGGDADMWRRRHAEHFAAFAEEAGPAIRGPDELLWRRRLSAELDNLRSAATWALDAGAHADRELALRIVAALAMQETFDPSLGIGAWAERAVEAAEATTPGRRHAVFSAAAYHHATAGRFDAAVDLADSALRGGIPPDAPWPSLATNTLSFVDLQRGAFTAAAERLEAFLSSPEAALIDLPEQVTFYAMAGGIRAGAGDLERGRSHTEQAIAISRRTGNPSALCSSLYSHGFAIRGTDPDRAIEVLEESIALVREGATPVMLGYASGTLALLRGARGERELAVRALRDALVFVERIGDRPQFLNVCFNGVQTLAALDVPEPVPVLIGYVMTAGVTVPEEPGSAQEAFMAAVASARAALGEDVFDAQVERGAAMSYDEMMRYFLDEVDMLIGATAGG